MTAFFVLAALLVAATLGTLGWSVLRPDPAPDGTGAADGVEGGSGDGQRDANVAIAREQLAALERARAAGDVDEAGFADERDRLERSLAAALDASAPRRRRRAAAVALAAFIGVGVPVAAGVMYLQVGQPQALALGPDSRGAGTEQAQGGRGSAAEPGTAAPADGTDAAGPADPQRAAALEELLPQLEARLAERPDDLAGWTLLGRTYLNLERFDEAATALERASGLAPNDVDLLSALAEARAMRAGGTLLGDALEPLEAAVELDPMHEQSLWLLGIARQQAGDHRAAIELLTRLRGIATGAGNAEAVATIDDYLSRSREALGRAPVAPGGIDAEAGVPAAAADAAPAAAPRASAAVADDDASAGTAAVTVSVGLSDEAAAATSPDQAVFVFARAVDGPPMPLAVTRLTVADLPATVTLDESMAMMPTMTIGAFPEVVVGARVSASGQPAAVTGDWFDEEAGVDASAAPSLELTIDRQVP